MDIGYTLLCVVLDRNAVFCFYAKILIDGIACHQIVYSFLFWRSILTTTHWFLVGVLLCLVFFVLFVFSSNFIKIWMSDDIFSHSIDNIHYAWADSVSFGCVFSKTIIMWVMVYIESQQKVSDVAHLHGILAKLTNLDKNKFITFVYIRLRVLLWFRRKIGGKGMIQFINDIKFTKNYYKSSRIDDNFFTCKYIHIFILREKDPKSSTNRFNWRTNLKKKFHQIWTNLNSAKYKPKRTNDVILSVFDFSKCFNDPPLIIKIDISQRRGLCSW